MKRQITLNFDCRPFGLADTFVFRKGQKIMLDCDSQGTPLIKYWRDRARDAVNDNCITFEKMESDEPEIEAPKKAKPKPKTGQSK